jgi:proteic killer suppression protein
VIKSWRHKGLGELFQSGRSRRIAPSLQSRILRRLDRLNVATTPAEMNIPGFDFHPLKGKPQRYTVHVNGPWCITFGWQVTDAVDVNLEQYH